MDKELVRKGQCSRCGDCCRGAVVFKSLNMMEKAFFRGISREAYAKAKYTNCIHLEILKDGTTRCGQYEKRPSFCKLFPANTADIKGMNRCGFRFELKK